MKTLLARGRPAEVLLVEDNQDDVELTKIGFRRAKFDVNLRHVSNGEECLAYLRKQGQYAGVATPDLILLDLNMPRMDGREVLQAMSEDAELRHLPVVILTTSDAEQDVSRAYELQCSSYIVKPIDFENFARSVQGIADYWFTLVVLPQQ